jgi:hypothetical protein
MTKLIFLCRRRPDITHQHYVELLLKGHVPIALAHHPTLRKYVINIVELHFASELDLRERMYYSAAGEEIIRQDIARFIGKRAAYQVGEHVEK